MDASASAGDGLSVLMSTYAGDVPQYLHAAIESVVNQTRPPDEIVVVQDGPTFPERLAAVVDIWMARCPNLFRVISLPNHLSLGLALKIGMQACSHATIGRMDADDLSMPSRFEEQMRFLQEHPEIDVVGSWVQVFDEDPNRILFETHQPVTHEEIRRIAVFRSPTGHGDCMYRRDAVLAAGGYCDCAVEDYHLWARMLLNGSRMANIPKFLYRQRRTKALGRRRGGLRRLRAQVLLQREFLRLGFVSLPRFALNVALRAVVCLSPYKLVQHLRFRFGLDTRT